MQTNQFHFAHIALAGLAATLLLPLPAHAGELHVSKSGKDSNPGTLEQPFQTIGRAAAAAAPGDSVLIRAGIYREEVIPPRSGEAGKPIVFRNYQDETVSVSGAELIDPKAWKTGANGAYQACAPMLLGTANQLFLDGRMMIEARFPNSSLDVTRPVKLTAKAGSFTGSGKTAEGTIHHDALNQPANHWVGANLHISLGKVWIAETAKVSHNLLDKDDPMFVEGHSYELQEKSPARNAGIAKAPYTVSGAGRTPDLGALPFGVPPWKAGSSLMNRQSRAAAKNDPSARSTTTVLENQPQ